MDPFIDLKKLENTIVTRNIPISQTEKFLQKNRHLLEKYKSMYLKNDGSTFSKSMRKVKKRKKKVRKKPKIKKSSDSDLEIILFE